MCVNEQVKGGERLPQQHTSVSGFEGLYVARGVLLLHSHLLPQRLCSHSVDDTVANLQRAAHRVNGTRARTVLMAFPSSGCTCLACCLRLSVTESGSTFFHSAAMQRKTSAPPFSTWGERFVVVKNLFTQRSQPALAAGAADLQQTLVLGQMSQHSQLQLRIIGRQDHPTWEREMQMSDGLKEKSPLNVHLMQTTVFVYTC